MQRSWKSVSALQVTRGARVDPATGFKFHGEWLIALHERRRSTRCWIRTTPLSQIPHTRMLGAWALPRGDICCGEAENSILIFFFFVGGREENKKFRRGKLRQRAAEATRRRSVKDGQMEGTETLTGTCHPCSPAFSLPLLSVTSQTRSSLVV